MPDTNLLLHHRDDFDAIDWPALLEARSHDQVNLVLAMVVLDELDRHKRTNNRTRARMTLRHINSLFVDPALSSTMTPRGDAAGPVVAHLFLDDPRHVQLPHSDSELVDRAVALSTLSGRQVTIVTFDTGMALRARAAGLPACRANDTFESTPEDKAASRSRTRMKPAKPVTGATDTDTDGP